MDILSMFKFERKRRQSCSSPGFAYAEGGESWTGLFLKGTVCEKDCTLFALLLLAKSTHSCSAAGLDHPPMSWVVHPNEFQMLKKIKEQNT
eukprot:scaffold56406_cov18-Tisochrysis_lutea.AAC.1